MTYFNNLQYLGPSPIILAAGAGRRMGGVEKACLKVGGRTLLERHFGNFAELGLNAERVSVVYGTEGVLRDECSAQLSSFFQALRARKKAMRTAAGEDK